MAWARHTWLAAQHVSTGGAYINLLAADEGADRVGSASGGNYGRLAEIKAAYDPYDFFRISHNVQPTHTSQRSAIPQGRRPSFFRRRN